MNMFELRTAYQDGKLTKQQYIQEMHRRHAVLHEYSAFMRDTDVAEISITGEQVVMTLKETGIKLLCDPADERIIPIEILNLGTFEKTELELVKRMTGARATIWDVGANVGWYSINLAKAFPQAQILAFEPIPSTYKQLEKNIELNQVSNVRTHPFGFSDKPGHLTFYFYPECSGNASTANLSEKASVRTLQCPVKTLDDFAAESGYAVDLIKCDVEGAELFVFKGGLKTIARQQPVIFTEMLRKWSAKFNYHPNDLIKLLTGIGYRCFAASGDKLVEFVSMDENTTETNFFFLHPDKHAGWLKTLCLG
jgi:FkbM family methyltransferase